MHCFSLKVEENYLFYYLIKVSLVTMKLLKPQVIFCDFARIDVYTASNISCPVIDFNKFSKRIMLNI